MDRYDIKPEGLGEINIDLSDDGEWVRFDDIEHLLSDAQKTAHNSDYAKCPECGGDMTCLLKHCPICLHEWQ